MRVALLHSESNEDVDTDAAAKEAAAILIQRLWRGKNNRAKQEFMNPSLRWDDALVHAKLSVDRTAAQNGKNSARDRWRRAAYFAARLQDRNSMLDSIGVHNVDAEEKHLETQHWLELVDDIDMALISSGIIKSGKKMTPQRTFSSGKNLSPNFNDDFRNISAHRLDNGSGKDLSLNECPRDRLEKEVRITLVSWNPY
ncbi:hypothetical protein BDQ17DRAFT_13607 [Cyathus striatus]|nr:hypothetical protein BDQ17DRAFT_13607 [Cyathus striatus]